MEWYWGLIQNLSGSETVLRSEDISFTVIPESECLFVNLKYLQLMAYTISIVNLSFISCDF